MHARAWCQRLAALVVLGLIGWSAGAQDKPAQPRPTPVPAAAVAGVQSQNIFDVKPAASEDPGYASQTNGERAKVQPGNNAPMWRQVSAGVTGYSSLPLREAPEAGQLIQQRVKYPLVPETNAGEAWRQVRNQWIIPYGGALILVALVALGLMAVTKGRMGRDYSGQSARIERFTPFERAAHMTNAVAFVLLALSGLTMAFGKFVLAPVIGSTLFGWLAYVLKNVHNFTGPVFAVSLIVVLLTFLKDNIANLADFAWLAKAGGMFGGEHQIPSHRFNAGEKGMYWWGMCIPGLLIVATGLALDKLIPGWGELRGEMQIAHMIHATAAIWMMAVLSGHIYMGFAVRGAMDALKTGYVSEGWAQEHHNLWLDDIKAGKIPAQRSAAAPPVAPVATANPSA
jgi:formate dehydrogenase subunit gamma